MVSGDDREQIQLAVRGKVELEAAGLIATPTL